ncbi:hypothetical protein L596_000309 [Steinernema carpocapsae]|uniref:Zinc/iron permease n=1 Tax=Steinernema carpocapsae TaxID=34508 RepID=A0A4U8UJ59_STECR|nr:hypothetical protein L596_000309 [Steinernema carpocapsae]
MNSIVLQICLAVAMFLTTTVAGLLPFKVLRVISKKEKGDKAKNILTLLSCFAGGVFLGTCFLDIIPHVKSNFQTLLKTAGWHTTYPFPEFFACFGFFLVYALEEITLRIFAMVISIPMVPSLNTRRMGVNVWMAKSLSAIENVIHMQNYPLLLPLFKIYAFISISIGPYYCCQITVKAVYPGAESEPFKPHNPPTNHQDSTDTYMAVQTHEKVMDETVNYMSGTSSNEGGLLKSITFAVAMSFHSILEGFALGVQDNSTGIMTLFISLMIHKGVEAFSVGLQISRSNSQRFRIVLVTVTIYALMTPVGSMIGVLIRNMNINEVPREATIVVLEGMAAGTFIYVTFFEVLAQERANDYSNLKQLYAIIAGFLVIAGLQINEHFVQGHSHDGH